MSSEYEALMRDAILEAKKGLSWVAPNPMVAAILLDEDGKFLVKAYHQVFGGPHAEQEAFLALEKTSKKAHTLLVTLEPCSHEGKTPSCAKKIIEMGVKRVVYGTIDPNPKVCGKGLEILRNAGIELIGPMLENEVRDLNHDFFFYFERGRPWITLKLALSLNGKMGLRECRSILTSTEANLKVHELRKRHQAIMVGAGTVLNDDPHLGVRHLDGKDPVRIIMKGNRKLPKDAKVFRDDHYLIYENSPIKEVFKDLYEKEHRSILIEPGPILLDAILREDIWDEFIIFLTPKVLSGNALDAFQESYDRKFEIQSVEKLGPDLCLKIV